MAASAKSTSLEKSKPAEEWTIVLPRRGKQKDDSKKTIQPKMYNPGQFQAPIGVESDPDKELKLRHMMNTYIEKVESSQFYQAFKNQLQNHEMSDLFSKVLGSEEKMLMVIYGIGSIESCESPRLQLSLALLMKKKFSWIGDVEVFDPIISSAESKVLSDLGCSVLFLNEEGRRKVSKPTLFFMPHCDASLYDNLLQANWEVDRLNQIVLFGNSFEAYEQILSIDKNSVRKGTGGHIFAIRRFTNEFAINPMSDDYFRAFNSSSWHFFTLEPGEDMQMFKT